MQCLDGQTINGKTNTHKVEGGLPKPGLPPMCNLKFFLKFYNSNCTLVAGLCVYRAGEAYGKLMTKTQLKVKDFT